MRWKSFNGKSVNIEEIDHQHLSNIYWYCKIFNRSFFVALDELNKRFDGKILEYRPKWEFIAERRLLDINKRIKWNESKTAGDILFNGERVGVMEHPLIIRDNKLKNIIGDA